VSEENGEFVVRVENLKKHFPLRKGFFETLVTRQDITVKAVDGISFGVEGRDCWLGGGEREWEDYDGKVAVALD